MVAALELHNVVKTYGATRALDGFHLRVDPGQVHGFLGPNGAGKTTALRVLLGLARMDSGASTLLGGDPWSDAVELHRRLAYVPGDVALWPNLSGGEIIDLLGRLRGGWSPQRRSALIERFHLDPTKRGRSYSKGNRQKVALIAALASDAELLLLDEPTSGLDPLMEAEFRACIADERDRGRTVLLSSHILSEVEATCDHITIIRAGRAVETGRIADLRHLSSVVVRADLRGAPPATLTSLPGVSAVEVTGHRLTCRCRPEGLNELLAQLTSVGISTLTTTAPSLEDVFLRFYDGSEDAAPSDGTAAP
ncbi:MAG: ATP-binding cassette domain-containing protein [Actinomycetes bacterium]